MQTAITRVQIQGNQPDTLDALQNYLGDVSERPTRSPNGRKKGDAIDRRWLWLELENRPFFLKDRWCDEDRLETRPGTRPART